MLYFSSSSVYSHNLQILHVDQCVCNTSKSQDVMFWICKGKMKKSVLTRMTWLNGVKNFWKMICILEAKLHHLQVVATI